MGKGRVYNIPVKRKLPPPRTALYGYKLKRGGLRGIRLTGQEKAFDPEGIADALLMLARDLRLQKQHTRLAEALAEVAKQKTQRWLKR